MLDLERNNEILQKIAAKLRLLRRKAGLLQKTVSAETGLNMGHLEGARKNVTLTTLERLCEYYSITLDEFFKDIDILKAIRSDSLFRYFSTLFTGPVSKISICRMAIWFSSNSRSRWGRLSEIKTELRFSMFDRQINSLIEA